MKNIISTLLLFFAVFAFGQDNKDAEPTGLPGDHFSLEGALTLFQQSETPEAFEQAINTESNHVNNLDLNGDGDIDYVKVISKVDNNLQLFVLQVSVSENENQDIAVIELEKSGPDNAIVQIIGDEEIYGEECIVEPSDDSEVNDMDDQVGIPDRVNNDDRHTVVNVWNWPSVRYVYAPGYRPWISPWRWRTYPNWWRPWRPLGWGVWHPYRIKYYHPRVRVVRYHRIPRAQKIYRPTRVTSTTVRTRNAAAHSNYKVTRKTTKVTGPRGNSVTKKTTKVQGAKGNVRTKKTTVKKSRKRN